MRVFATAALACAALTASALSAEADASAVLPTDVKRVCGMDAKQFDEHWLKLTFRETKGNPLTGQTIGPFYDRPSGLTYIFPADGPNFEEGAYGSDEACAFFEWGNHMFYWLTSTIQDGKMGVRPDAPEPPNADTLYVFSGEWFYQLVEGETGPTLVSQGLPGAKDRHSVRAVKSDADGIDQAGGGGVLFTQAQGVSHGSSPVYYSVHTNRNYGYLRDAVLKDSWLFHFTEFPDSQDEACRALYHGLLQGYVDLSGEFGPLTLLMIDSYCPIAPLQDILAEIEDWIGHEVAVLEKWFPGLKDLLNALSGENPFDVKNLGKIENLVPYIEPAVDYLAMATELKASWVRADTLKTPGEYILHKGDVPVFGPPDANGVMTQTGVEKDVELALIGMHIVGTVKGHPEMVWATVEHYANAPSLPYHYRAADGSVKSWDDRARRPGADWLLSDGSDTAVNAEYAQFSAADGQTAASIAPTGANPAATPTNALRLSPLGSPDTAASADLNSALISMNMSVYETFQAYNSGYPGVDPRQNYVLAGVSWGHGGQFPDGSDASQIAGTARMASTSMETFTQTMEGTVNATGCFRCHNPTQSGSPFGISHIFHRITKVEP